MAAHCSYFIHKGAVYNNKYVLYLQSLSKTQKEKKGNNNNNK